MKEIPYKVEIRDKDDAATPKLLITQTVWGGMFIVWLGVEHSRWGATEDTEKNNH